MIAFLTRYVKIIKVKKVILQIVYFLRCNYENNKANQTRITSGINCSISFKRMGNACNGWAAGTAEEIFILRRFNDL